MRMVILVSAASLLLAMHAFGASTLPVPVVCGGKASAVIVTPDNPKPSLALAVDELRLHVKKATGVDLQVATEDAVPKAPTGRIYLGRTKAALGAGLDPDKLQRDTYYVRATGDAVFLVGNDGDGAPLNKYFYTSVGTLFAVYEVLDDDLGVRWLWPGDLGTFVPKTRDFSIKPRDEKVEPRFRFCKLRTDRREDLLWMRRMRMHGAEGMIFGHAFGDWAGKYGAEHPDWFEMGEDSARHPGGSMCVSNPGLWKQIVDNWWAAQASGKTTVNVCENDINGNCRCPTCLSWDGPEAPKPRPSYYATTHNVSRRYARFASEVLELAQEHDPNAEVTMYSYLNYVYSPSGVTLHPHIIAGFVADVLYPRMKADHEWVKRQWLGWHRTGASMFFRPNYLLQGYAMPMNYTHQYADEWRFCEARGMIGTDFDSLNGEWSTQGPLLYTVGRFHAKPRMPVDKILAEYYSAFGPAAAKVKEYWNYWERYTMNHVQELQDGHTYWFQYPKDAYKRYRIESFGPAEALLQEALKAASKDDVARQRVEFLLEGLNHARLCVIASHAIAEKGGESAEGRAVLEKLREFRKNLKYPFSVNVDYRFFSCVELEKRAGWPQ